MLYWVYTDLYSVCTGLYSVQISIYRYKIVYTCMTAYILIQDCIYLYGRCISEYIRVWTWTYENKIVYTHMNTVYLGTSPYICVWNIVQKCVCFGLRTMHLMHTARLFIPLRHERWYSWSPPYDIRLRFGNAAARHLLAGLVSDIRSGARQYFCSNTWPVYVRMLSAY